MESELLACPWCGGVSEAVELSDQPPMWHVECESSLCCAVGPVRDTKAEAIAAWNTRSTTDKDARAATVGREAMQAYADYANGLITRAEFIGRIQSKIEETAS